MATTKRKLADQVMVILKGGDPGVASSIDMRDLMELVGQTINELLKAEYYGPHLQAGEIAADGLMMATYDGIKVKSAGDYSTITLPCMPVKLIKNMGLYEISKTDDHFGYNRFIPVPVGLAAGIKRGMSYTTNVLGHIFYVNTNLLVTFDHNIVEIDGIDEVSVRLVVADLNSLTEFEPLPVSADMEGSIVRGVLSYYNVQFPADKTTDISAEQTTIK